ncbi:MAG: hypothetical protein ACLSAP_08985 [Oscillospiraceae bacterium]
MFVTCDRQLLCDAVSSVSRAVPGKSTIPALEGILLNAAENTLTLSGYDLELGITTKIASENKQPGRIILNAKLFSEMTKHMAGDQVTIQCDEKLLTTIRCGNSEFNILKGWTPTISPSSKRRRGPATGIRQKPSKI